MTSTDINQTATPDPQEIHKGFVIEARFEKTVKLNSGTYYQYAIKFKDGISGEYLSKSSDQRVFLVGNEVSYTLKRQAAGQHVYNKIYPVREKQTGKFDREIELLKQRLIVRQHAQKVAADLISKISPALLNEMVKSKQISPTLKALAHDLEDDIFRDLSI